MGGDNSKELEVQEAKWEAERAALDHQKDLREKEIEANEVQRQLREKEEELRALQAKPVELEEPFRDVVSMDQLNMDKLKKELETTKSFCEEVAPTLRLLLLGMVGHGKSSFVNTIHSTMKGKVVAPCPAGSDAKSVTKQFREHIFGAAKKLGMDSRGRPRLKAEGTPNFCLCDTMGVEGEDGISERDMGYILDGYIQDAYKFSVDNPINSNSDRYRRNPDPLKHIIHCVGVCVDASKLAFMRGPAFDKIKRIKSEITARELPFIIILTKVDMVCELVKKKPAKTFKSPKVQAAVEKAADIFGVPANQVYPVKNYEHESGIVPAMNILSIYACLRMLQYANEMIEMKLSTNSDSDEEMGNEDRD